MNVYPALVTDGTDSDDPTNNALGPSPPKPPLASKAMLTYAGAHLAYRVTTAPCVLVRLVTLCPLVKASGPPEVVAQPAKV